MVKYSIIIPVYNRPDEVGELITSLTAQEFKSFELIIVEDGSTVTCRHVCEAHSSELDLHYFAKTNGGPGKARNYGAERAQGEYLIFLDSDVIVPQHYLEHIESELDTKPCDAFGGPDRAHSDFTDVQKAINYSMTSFLTTGGIRGGKKKLDKFYPRSFNLGIKRNVFNTLGGFSDMRFGEDIDLSIRIFKQGHSCRLFPEAWVWHKRRATFRQFFKQVFNSGMARINLYEKYPESLKAVHTLPALFTAGLTVLVLMFIVGLITLLVQHSTIAIALTLTTLGLFAGFCLLIGITSAVQNRSIKVGALSVIASLVQLTGYGSGFIYAVLLRLGGHKKRKSAFDKNFYD